MRNGYAVPDLMLKIDIHTHIIPEEMPRWSEKFGYGGFIHLDHHKVGCARMMSGDKFFREIESNCWDPHVRISEYDDFGVQCSINIKYWKHIRKFWNIFDIGWFSSGGNCITSRWLRGLRTATTAQSDLVITGLRAGRFLRPRILINNLITGSWLR